MKTFVNSLQKAYCGEVAASFAYEGHMASVSCSAQKEMLEKIWRDELAHIVFLEKTLKQLGCPKVNRLRLSVFIAIGKLLGLLCHYTGWYLPMKVAQIIEHIGTTEYGKLALEAHKLGLYDLSIELSKMARVENEHAKYFQTIIKHR